MAHSTIIVESPQPLDSVQYGDLPRASKDVEQNSNETLIRPSKRRYFIVLMYIILKISNSFHWICMGIITNIVSSYYGTDSMTINWLAILFLIAYVLLALPITWISDYIGLRGCMLVGSFATTIGVIIKCFGCHPNGLYIVFMGQLFICIASPFFYSLSSSLASVWFPDDQVAVATSCGLIGGQLGDAFAFVVPGLMVGYDMHDFEAIHSGLFRMFLGNSILVTVNTVCVLFFFKNQPKYAPGIARFKQLEFGADKKANKASLMDEIKSQVRLIKELTQDWHYIQLLVGYAIAFSANFTVHTVINQMIVNESPSSSWEEATAVAGRAGLIIVVISAAGFFAGGFVLDTFHRFKLTAILSDSLTLLSMVLFTLSLKLQSPWCLYASTIPLGFFESCYLCAALEYAVEITYPKSELVSSSLLNVSAALMGIPVTILAAIIVETFGNQATGWFLCGLFAISLLLTCLQGGELKRQKARTGEFVYKSSPHQ